MRYSVFELTQMRYSVFELGQMRHIHFKFIKKALIPTRKM